MDVFRGISTVYLPQLLTDYDFVYSDYIHQQMDLQNNLFYFIVEHCRLRSSKLTPTTVRGHLIRRWTRWR